LTDGQKTPSLTGRRQVVLRVHDCMTQGERQVTVRCWERLEPTTSAV